MNQFGGAGVGSPSAFQPSGIPDGLFPAIPGAQGLSPSALQLIQEIQMTEGPAAAQAVMTKLRGFEDPLMQQMMLRGAL
jgi:hypothetical protein